MLSAKLSNVLDDIHTQPYKNYITALNLSNIVIKTMHISHFYWRFPVCVLSAVNDQRMTKQSCPWTWSQFHGRCYKFFSEPRTWVEAEVSLCCFSHNFLFLSTVLCNSKRCLYLHCRNTACPCRQTFHQSIGLRITISLTG